MEECVTLKIILFNGKHPLPSITVVVHLSMNTQLLKKCEARFHLLFQIALKQQLKNKQTNKQNKIFFMQGQWLEELN